MAGITTQTATLATIPTATPIAADQVGTATAPTTGDRIQYVKLDCAAAGASAPVTGTNPLPVRAAKDAGRTAVHFFAEAVAGATAEALVTLTISSGGPGSATATGTSYQVPAGKTLRIETVVATLIATTTTANTSRLRMRWLATSPTLIGSPVAMSFPRMGFETATFVANESSAPLVMPITEGFEIPAGASFGITHQEAAANGTVDLLIKAYLY